MKSPSLLHRTFILTFSSLLLFGTYFVHDFTNRKIYDLPSILITEIGLYFGVDESTAILYVSYMNSFYSWPNVFLPFVGGLAIQKYGIHKPIIFLSLLITGGQALFALGFHLRLFPVALLGRLLVGTGSECLGVAQSALTNNWFKGSSLTFALAVNLFVARLGSLSMDHFGAKLTIFLGLSVFLWISVALCGFSLCAASFLVVVEKKWGNCRKKIIKTADLEENEPLLTSEMNEEDEEKKETVEKEKKDERKQPDENNQTDKKEEIEGLIVKSEPIKESWTVKLIRILEWNQIRKFPLSFWLLSASLSLHYSATVSISGIVATVLQRKWFPDNSVAVGFVYSICDTISAILPPFAGLFIDHFRIPFASLFAASVFVILFITFIFYTWINPIVSYALLGLAYSIDGPVMWSLLSKAVPDECVPAAVGFATCFYNIALAVTPLIAAQIVSIDPTFVFVGMFFLIIASLGLINIVILYLTSPKLRKSHQESTLIE